MGASPSHAFEQLARQSYVVEDAECDRDVVVVDVLEILPAALLDLDQPWEDLGLLSRELDHRVGGVDAGHMDPSRRQRGEQRPAPAPDVEDPLRAYLDADLHRETQPIEEGPSAEHPRHRLARVEGGEAAGTPLEVGLEITARHEHTPCFRIA